MNFQIYITDITSLENPDMFSRGMDYVSKFRREKVEKIKLLDDKLRSLAAGILFEYACNRNEINREEQKIVLNAAGKPSFAAQNGYYFNLSHSGKRAMCAFAKAVIGCDVEQSGRFNESFIRRFFGEEEVSYLLNVPESMLNNECTRIWTLKESYMKCDGRGIGIGAETFSVVDKNGNICLSGSAHSEGCKLFNVATENGYYYSCAIYKGKKGTICAPVIEWIRIEDIFKGKI